MTRNIFFCPTTKLALSKADDALLQLFNGGIEAGNIRNQAGQLVKNTQEELLINLEAQIAYSVHIGIPQLLPQLAVSLAQLNQGNTVD